MAQQPQHDPSPTPLSGNAVLTVNTLVTIVVVVIGVLRAYGKDISSDQEFAIVQFLQGPGGEVVIGIALAIATAISRSRVYSELSVKKLTKEERPAV